VWGVGKYIALIFFRNTGSVILMYDSRVILLIFKQKKSLKELVGLFV
jgi:hypothetical protein